MPTRNHLCPKTTSNPLIPELRRFGQIDAHHRLFISLAVAAVVVCGAVASWHWPIRALVTWNAYSVSTLVMTWFSIVSADPSEVGPRSERSRIRAARPFSLSCCWRRCASMFAVAAELGTAKGLDRTHLAAHILFCLLTIVRSWALVHTVFTLRYAHIYYDTATTSEAHGGLNFPDEDKARLPRFRLFFFRDRHEQPSVRRVDQLPATAPAGAGASGDFLLSSTWRSWA